MPKVAKAKTVLQEILATGMTKEHVHRRVEDWQRRISDLYVQIEEWLPDGWKAIMTRRIRLNAPMMKAHKVPGVNLPCLELRGPNGRKIHIRPGGLWVVGFNGLIDVKTATEHLIIVDVADIFTEPQWRLTGLYDRGNGAKLDRRRFRTLLTEE